MSSFTDASFRNRIEARKSLRGYGPMIVAIVVLGVVLGVAMDAEAARRYGRSSYRRASAAAQAQKKQAIAAIQRQVASAKQVLAAAQSQSAMTESQISTATASLSKIRGDINGAHDDVREANKSLHAIEAEIIAEQLPDTDYAKAKAAFDQAQQALHLVIHRLVGLPDKIAASESKSGAAELAKLTPEQRKGLDTDAIYQSALGTLQRAETELSKQRKKLFVADSDWVAGERELHDANERSRDDNNQASHTGADLRREKTQLGSIQEIAMEAKNVIAQGELRLRQLGAKPLSTSSSSKKSSASGN